MRLSSGKEQLWGFSEQLGSSCFLSLKPLGFLVREQRCQIPLFQVQCFGVWIGNVLKSGKG